MRAYPRPPASPTTPRCARIQPTGKPCLFVFCSHRGIGARLEPQHATALSANQQKPKIQSRQGSPYSKQRIPTPCVVDTTNCRASTPKYCIGTKTALSPGIPIPPKPGPGKVHPTASSVSSHRVRPYNELPCFNSEVLHRDQNETPPRISTPQNPVPARFTPLQAVYPHSIGCLYNCLATLST